MGIRLVKLYARKKRRELIHRHRDGKNSRERSVVKTTNTRNASDKKEK